MLPAQQDFGADLATVPDHLCLIVKYELLLLDRFAQVRLQPGSDHLTVFCISGSKKRKVLRPAALA